MLELYKYPLMLLIILAILFIPFKFIVVKIQQRREFKLKTIRNKEVLIKAVDKLPFKERMKIWNMLKARTKTNARVSDGLLDIAEMMKQIK